MNDSVREELQTKIGSRGTRPEPAVAEAPVAVSFEAPTAVRIQTSASGQTASDRPAPKIETTELDIKNTCQTLMDFQNKNAALPDWRIELQNSVRRRKNGGNEKVPADEKAPEPFRKKLVTHGANALKPEAPAENENVKHEDPIVLNALKRIEASRRTFMPRPEPKPASAPSKAVPNRTYPFNVISRGPNTAPAPAQTEQRAETPRAKPQLVSKLRIEKRSFDTNKLGPLPEPAPIAAKFEAPPAAERAKTPPEPEKTETRLPKPVIDQPAVPNIFIGDAEKLDEATNRELDALHFGEVAEAEPSDDLAPLSMRFGAGLFDVIIGAFAGLLLLSPFALAVENWFTLSSGFAFFAAFSIMLFLYMTGSITRYGKTLGMHLFSLEVIDASDNIYPTLHQAAVRSAAFLISLGFAGLGFLTVFFTGDRQAIHDLISRTVVVREV